ncbi:MAG: GTPase HflX [Litorivicinaceae bacterium]|nr:GTPase HflX [Litorivicinaceae bacterium]
MFIEREAGGERALICSVSIRDPWYEPDPSEFESLVLSAGAEIVGVMTANRQKPSSANYIGSGKVEELAALVEATESDLVIFDGHLSPSQERNLERQIKARVIDRSGLILDIFASRAQTFEGKLQVELAQLDHIRTRLIRGWTHLERQKGGIGLRGPGETQLETDRRLLDARVVALKNRLEKVRKTRDQGRRSRKRNAIPTIALVGYTNSGKSTLFNALTHSSIYAADQLFATLDPTLRRIALPGGASAILADTVGFVQNLPHALVDAFRATLEEAALADVLLFVQDGAHRDRAMQALAVREVLTEIGAGDVPRIEVMNKVDQRPEVQPGLGEDGRIWISAHSGAGFDALREAIAEAIGQPPNDVQVCLAPSEGRARALLYAHSEVISEQVSEDGDWTLQIRISPDRLAALSREVGRAL